MSAVLRHGDAPSAYDEAQDRITREIRQLGEDEWKSYMQDFLGRRENAVFSARWTEYLREQIAESLRENDGADNYNNSLSVGVP